MQASPWAATATGLSSRWTSLEKPTAIATCGGPSVKNLRGETHLKASQHHDCVSTYFKKMIQNPALSLFLKNSPFHILYIRWINFTQGDVCLCVWTRQRESDGSFVFAFLIQILNKNISTSSCNFKLLGLFNLILFLLLTRIYPIFTLRSLDVTRWVRVHRIFTGAQNPKLPPAKNDRQAQRTIEGENDKTDQTVRNDNLYCRF